MKAEMPKDAGTLQLCIIGGGWAGLTTAAQLGASVMLMPSAHQLPREVRGWPGGRCSPPHAGARRGLRRLVRILPVS